MKSVVLREVTVQSALFANQCLKTPVCKGSDLTHPIAMQKLSSTQGNYSVPDGEQPNYSLFFVGERGASLRPSNLFCGAHLVIFLLC